MSDAMLGDAAVVLGVVLAVVLFALMYPALRRGGFAFAARKKRQVQVRISPPPPRFGVPGPTTVDALEETLRLAGVGRVMRRGTRLEVRASDGHNVWIFCARSVGLKLADLRVEASSDLLCASVLDALAPRVGPMELELDGVTLFVDGTSPRETIERELHDRRMELLQAAEHRPSRSSKPDYLN